MGSDPAAASRQVTDTVRAVGHRLSGPSAPAAPLGPAEHGVTEAHARDGMLRRWGGAGYRAAKRALDVLLGTMLLAVSIPILGAACIAIVLETPGSPLFLQWRSGLNGRPFRLVKLRTMVANAERLGPALTQFDDPRITRVGSLLRRWSVDELPQLLNVLAGEMSLVGPRPELIPIVDTYSPRQREVLRAKPGLTGWAQVNGRDDVPIPAKLELELAYLAGRTIWKDLSILVRTAHVILSGQGTKR